MGSILKKSKKTEIIKSKTMKLEIIKSKTIKSKMKIKKEKNEID